MLHQRAGQIGPAPILPPELKPGLPRWKLFPFQRYLAAEVWCTNSWGCHSKQWVTKKGSWKNTGFLGLATWWETASWHTEKTKFHKCQWWCSNEFFLAKKTKNLEIFPYCFLRVKFWEMIVMFVSVIPKRHPQTKPWFSIASTQKRGLFVEDHRIVTG